LNKCNAHAFSADLLVDIVVLIALTRPIVLTLFPAVYGHFLFLSVRIMLPSTLDPTTLICLHFSSFRDFSDILNGCDEYSCRFERQTHRTFSLVFFSSHFSHSLPLICLFFATIFIDFLLILFMFNLSYWYFLFWFFNFWFFKKILDSAPSPCCLPFFLNNVLIWKLVADL